jgi:SAM-dependent methyltransferase
LHSGVNTLKVRAAQAIVKIQQRRTFHMDRIARLLGAATRSQRIVEIGAGYCPVAPKADGWQTHVVDHASRDDLQTKYASANVDVGVIEDVDTIWHKGPLHEAVPSMLIGQVDVIIASHVLEHIPDLIGFLDSASRLVGPGGSLSVALPDRRYCFDCFKPWTTTGDLLEAHDQHLCRHSLKTAFNHMAYSAVVDQQLAWGPRPIAVPVLMDDFKAAADTVTLFQNQTNGPYADYHAWQFTPAGFQLAMLELGALGLIDWYVETLEGPENFEFFVSLRRRGGLRPSLPNLQTQRRDLLIRQLIEAREQIDFMLGTEAQPTPTPIPAQNDATYQQILASLAAQENKLGEIAQTLAWLGAALRPFSAIRRRLRRWV